MVDWEVIDRSTSQTMCVQMQISLCEGRAQTVDYGGSGWLGLSEEGGKRTL
jgi:hypothetical protein